MKNKKEMVWHSSIKVEHKNKDDSFCFLLFHFIFMYQGKDYKASTSFSFFPLFLLKIYDIFMKDVFREEKGPMILIFIFEAHGFIYIYVFSFQTPKFSHLKQPFTKSTNDLWKPPQDSEPKNKPTNIKLIETVGVLLFMSCSTFVRWQYP